MMFNFRYFKFFVIALMGLIFASAAFAFAAANTVPATAAGDGAGAISGYTVSNIQYVLNAGTPSNIDMVTFTLDSAATTVKIKLVAAGGTYYSCTNPSGMNWECVTTAPQATVLPADELRVIAAR